MLMLMLHFEGEAWSLYTSSSLSSWQASDHAPSHSGSTCRQSHSPSPFLVQGTDMREVGTFLTRGHTR